MKSAHITIEMAEMVVVGEETAQPGLVSVAGMRSLSSFAVVPSSCTLDVAGSGRGRISRPSAAFIRACEKTIVQDRAEQRNSRRQFSDTGAVVFQITSVSKLANSFAATAVHA